MPTKKTTKKATSKKCCDSKMDEVKKIADDLLEKMKDAKKKFDKMDEGTRKKIVAGAAGVVALFAGMKMMKKMKNKKTKK